MPQTKTSPQDGKHISPGECAEAVWALFNQWLQQDNICSAPDVQLQANKLQVGCSCYGLFMLPLTMVDQTVLQLHVLHATAYCSYDLRLDLQSFDLCAGAIDCCKREPRGPPTTHLGMPLGFTCASRQSSSAMLTTSCSLKPLGWKWFFATCFASQLFLPAWYHIIEKSSSNIKANWGRPTMPWPHAGCPAACLETLHGKLEPMLCF